MTSLPPLLLQLELDLAAHRSIQRRDKESIITGFHDYQRLLTDFQFSPCLDVHRLIQLIYLLYLIWSRTASAN